MTHRIGAYPRPTAPADGAAACETGHRSPDHPIDRIFVDRWSPRAFDASHLPLRDLMRMLEAARWAPSAYNIQPWRFVFARREDACWPEYLALLDPFNAAWASQASALVFLVSDSLMPADEEGLRKPSHTHGFDAGAAWIQLALQATALGYHSHAMAGLDFERAARVLELPAHVQVRVAIAIGRQADAATLPAALRHRERPSDRLPLAEIAFAGRYGKPAEPA